MKNELSLRPHVIRYLTVDRMDVRHADIDTRKVSENFVESVRQVLEVRKTVSEVPEWVPVVENLTE